MAVEDVWLAYCVDNAVHAFGSALEAELKSVKGKTDEEINRKRERILTKWLDLPQRFRNPGMVGSGNVDQEFIVRGG